MQQSLLQGHNPAVMSSHVVQPTGGMFVADHMLGMPDMQSMGGLHGQQHGGGMISLSDLQPGIQTSPSPHADFHDLQ
eukprot:scaffold499214_cov45-Prasinocladus_malaysianus.AAC.1